MIVKQLFNSSYEQVGNLYLFKKNAEALMVWNETFLRDRERISITEIERFKIKNDLYFERELKEGWMSQYVRKRNKTKKRL